MRMSIPAVYLLFVVLVASPVLVHALGPEATWASASNDVQEAIKVLETHLAYERTGRWSEWADLLHIRQYPELGLVVSRDDLHSGREGVPSGLVEYKILDVQLLSSWTTRPTKPWLEEDDKRYVGEPLSETYHGVVRVELERHDLFHDGQRGSLITYRYLSKIEGTWRIHWSPWFAFDS